MKTISVSICVLLILLSGCGSTGPQYQLVKLPSGKEVKVLGVGKIFFTQDEPALMLKYQTAMSLDDKFSLQKEEVDEIWDSFKPDVDKAGLQNAIISANEAPKGRFIRHNRSYNFVFKKSNDGTWKLLSD